MFTITPVALSIHEEASVACLNDGGTTLAANATW
jgi:hypothetical protein